MKLTTVLILGARSDIGMATAQIFARQGYSVQLAARRVHTLKADAENMEFCYAVNVTLHEFDSLDIVTHTAFLDALTVLPTIAVCVVGEMGKQTNSEQDLRAAVRIMRSNYEGPTSILAELANRFEQRGLGTLVGISSVAGERGRAKNYVYGSAKAGFTAFLSGLRNRLAKKGVHVVTVLPGFIATKMTRNMDLPAKLTAHPEEVARAVLKAVKTKRNIVYVKPIWWLLMIIIRNIPERVFKVMKI